MDRRAKRLERRRKKEQAKPNEVSGSEFDQPGQVATSDDKFAKLLTSNEDVLLNFVAKINKLYQEVLERPAPFVSFVICGMQSSGKSTIMERFLNAPLNIVQEGTGTRCPLDTTCIHDSSLTEPQCELSGKELDPSQVGTGLTTEEVFAAITEHNRELGDQDKFSTEPLVLVYRASNVQNMRFVDTPGIIATQGTGRDNRDDIKSILRNTMKKPNSKLCVLVEPKEFSTNAIIDFCDETFGGRGKWAKESIVLMTKFDKQLEDARSGSKANKFFSEYQENEIYPFLTITPTLDREDIGAEELFLKRKVLLESATDYEEGKFVDWQTTHAKYRETDPDDPKLSQEISSRIGFPAALYKMREVMLMDTATRLPEVLASLRRELAKYREELGVLEERQKYRDPQHLKMMIGNLLQDICNRIKDYLDGDLEAAARFPDQLMDLDEELELEEDSDWSDRTLGKMASIQEEEKWRDIIHKMFDKDTMPEHVCADKKFLGGKQFQRAVALLKAAMAEASPDITEMKDYVASGAGYLEGGLQRENWERATLSIVKMTSSMTVHPGINFLIKHVGTVFRNLFQVGLKDMKQRSVDTNRLLEICPGLENAITDRFDDMLWLLMQNAADNTHLSLEPWWSCLDPNLPNFCPFEEDEKSDLYEINSIDGSYVKTPSKSELREKKAKDGLMSSFFSVFHSTVDDKRAKELLRQRGKERAEERNRFLPEDRSSMINDEETEKIIISAFHYVVALSEQIQIYLNFQINHFLYLKFKQKISTFPRVVSSDDWKELIPADRSLDEGIEDLKNRITEIKGSLSDVQKMQTQF
ncbi:hypothetical protein ACHAWF_018970 [Thalassiosira exigua]